MKAIEDAPKDGANDGNVPDKLKKETARRRKMEDIVSGVYSIAFRHRMEPACSEILTYISAELDKL